MTESFYRKKLFRLTAKLGMIFLLYLMFVVAIAKASDKSPLLETFINDQMVAYPFDEDNLFKLSAYAELKGRYHAETKSFVLNFGKLGVLSFFPDHCLLKIGSDGYLSLNQESFQARQAIELNMALKNLFEQIDLLANHGATREHIQFVNEHLARKNLDPFDKIYTRHLLLKYGRYHSTQKAMLFHTDWLPKPMQQEALADSYSLSLGMKLDSLTLKGFYLGTGGEVFVENAEGTSAYATGELTESNVTAFKLFVQKLFTQTVHYLPGPTASKAVPSKTVRPQLYSPDGWIPMMLGILRSHETNIGDSDVIRYFKDQPCYPHIYAQMTKEEREAADRSLGR
ncbi:MAG: hypothetical protein AAF587_17405 [Bacteroidota bacterium]